jgi:hypothetical protein
LPDDLFPIDGYQSVHDPLHARVLVLEQAGERFVLASLELPSLRDYAVERLRSLLAERTGALVAHTWVTVTHTLSAPHTRSEAALADADVAARNQLLCDRIESACATATERALATLAPCAIGSARTDAPLNQNRDPGRFADHTLSVLRIDATSGASIALVYNHDLRPAITEDAAGDRRTVSADWPGAASRVLENATGGVAIFLPGAMADQAAVPTGRPAHEAADVIGEAMAERVRTAAAAADVRPDAGMHLTSRTCDCPGRAAAGRPLRVAVELQALRLGDAVVLGLRPELSSRLGSRIRAASPWPQTLVCSMVNGGDKQLVEDEAHASGTSVAQQSPFRPGAGGAVVSAAIDLLRTAHQSRSTVLPAKAGSSERDRWIRAEEGTPR